MKNVQVIEASPGSTFSIFQMTDEEFALVFPVAGQDMEFAEDLYERMGDGAAEKLLAAVWTRPVRKPDVAGLHGTLYYGFAERREHYPETKRECDFDAAVLSPHQLRLYGR
jgi:hypothetical protein